MTSDRILTLLDDAGSDRTRQNAVIALVLLAESHPEQVQHLAQSVDQMLSDSNTTIQAKTIEFLGYVKASEYRERIERIRSETDSDKLRVAANDALDRLSSDEPVGADQGAQKEDIISSSDILKQIESEFEDF
jgi:hypothetical protein